MLCGVYGEYAGDMWYIMMSSICDIVCGSQVGTVTNICHRM